MQFVYHNDGLQTKESSPKFSLREKGRLFSIKNDGTDSYPFIIKKDEVLFGSGLTCDVRIHVVGVAEEHCSIVILPNGKAYLNPLADSVSTCLNNLNVTGRVILLHNDIITIGNRRFRFQYPSGSSLTRFLSYGDDTKNEVKSDSRKKVHSAKNLLMLNSKRQSLPSRASDIRKGVRFGIKRKSLDFLDSTDRTSLRRRVTFGPRLSPEEFDKRLPPASPLRRGSLPNRKRSILNSAKEKIAKPAAASGDKRFKHCKALKIKFSPKCSTNLATTPVNEKDGSDGSKGKGPVVIKRLLFSEVVKKPVPIDDLCQKPAPCANKPKVLNVPADKCIKKLERCSNQKNLQQSLILKKFGISSTGHANSPATILISKAKRAASRDSSDSGNSADFIGTEASSCPEEYKHPSKVEVCMLANSDGFHKDQASGICNEGTKQISKSPVKCASAKSTPHSSPSLTIEINSNKAADKSRSSLSEGLARHTNEGNEKQFDSREAIKSLIFNSSLVSEISNNFGEASSSSSNCIDVVKQVVFALSMANAYHDYKNIIEDIIHSPQRSSLTFEVTNKNSSSPDEPITDNQEESSLKDLIKKNSIFLQLVHKYQPKLLSKEIQELLKDCETSNELSPGPPKKMKRTSCASLSSRRSFKKGEDGRVSRSRKKSSTGKEISLECSSRADHDSDLNLAEPKLKSPKNLSLLGNEAAESTSKGENSKRRKISTSPPTNQNVKLHRRSKHLKSGEKLTVSRRIRRKVSLVNTDLQQKSRHRRPVRYGLSRRSSIALKLKKRMEPDRSEEGSAKKSCLDRDDSMLSTTMSPIESRTSGIDLSLVQSNCIGESASEINTSGIQEMKTKSKIRSRRKNEPEATEQNNSLDLQRKSLKRKYSLRAVILKGRKSVSATDKRRRRKSSIAKKLVATAKTSIRKSKLLTIEGTPSSEVEVKDSKGLKGRRRKVRAVVSPKVSSTRSRKRANSLAKKDATSDRAVKKIILEDDPEKSLKNSEGTPAKSKLSTPVRRRGKLVVKSDELTKSRTPGKKRKLRVRNIENESSLLIEKEAPAIEHLSPKSKIIKKTPSKVAAGKRTRAKTKRGSLKSKDVSVELKSPVAKRSRKKKDELAKVSSDTKAVEKTPSKSGTGRRTKASAATNPKRRNLKSKDAPVENLDDDSTKKAKIEKLPAKTKVVRKRPGKGKDSISEKRVSPKRKSPEKRATRSTRRKISGGKKN